MTSGLSLWILILITWGSDVLAASKAPATGPRLDGKKVIEIEPVQNIQIEMPDGTWHNFGEDFQASFTTQMVQSGKYILTDADLQKKIHNDSLSLKSLQQLFDYHWSGSVTPSATVRFRIDALTFQTGFRGEKMFYGFDERFKTPFNDGSGKLLNEFPLRNNSIEPSWFGRSFERKGIYPFDSRSGLDLGDGFTIDALYAWLSVKYARYHSELRLQIEIQLGDSGIINRHLISVTGDGFFFDVAGAYEGYSAGISAARKDAMLQALKHAIDGSFQAIDRSLEYLPMMAKIDAVLNDGTILLGTGPFSEVRSGMKYYSIDDPQIQIEVSESTSSGSIAALVQGDRSLVLPGMVFKQVSTQNLEKEKVVIQSNSKMISEYGGQTVESVQLPIINLPSIPLDGLAPQVSKWAAVAKSILEGALLPYRIARYFLYNQSYHSRPDLGLKRLFDLQKEEWSRKIALSQVPEMSDASPIVAVIDSGVDYNHPTLHSSIWINPFSWQDPRGGEDRYGWDFTSQDSRPYDDGYHGTQLASLVVGVAPRAKVMPIKIFNPWGVTTSASIYAAFQYAVDHGAQIILCGWATPVSSQALEMGVAYAKDHGVVVVAAAGDFGINIDYNPYYPAAFAKNYDNVVAVTAVDSEDKLIRLPSRIANGGRLSVTIAAPGQDLPVAEPRSGFDRSSSTDLSAALVAGSLARYSADRLKSSYTEWVQDLLKDADSVPELRNTVKDGLRLHLKK